MSKSPSPVQAEVTDLTVDYFGDTVVDNGVNAVDSGSSSTEPHRCYPRSVDNPKFTVEQIYVLRWNRNRFIHNPQDLLPPLLFESHTLRKRIRL
jgi:hypothetical protein